MQFKIVLNNTDSPKVAMPLLPGVYLMTYKISFGVSAGPLTGASCTFTVGGFLNITQSAAAGTYEAGDSFLHASLVTLRDAQSSAAMTLSGEDASASAEIYICAERVGP